MSKHKETIAAIIAEMRLGFDQSWHGIDREWAHGLADRLEAALVREKAAIEADALAVGGIVEAARATAEKSSTVGNAARLREAVAQQSVNDADTAAWVLDKSPEDVCEERMSWSELCDMAYKLAAGFTTLRDAVKAALAKPPRNCDMGTAEEQTERFAEFCDNEKGNRNHCRNCRLCNARDCKFAWAQMPYEKGGAE